MGRAHGDAAPQLTHKFTLKLIDSPELARVTRENSIIRLETDSRSVVFSRLPANGDYGKRLARVSNLSRND